jgi:hypothetical protein
VIHGFIPARRKGGGKRGHGHGAFYDDLSEDEGGSDGSEEEGDEEETIVVSFPAGPLGMSMIRRHNNLFISRFVPMSKAGPMGPSAGADVLGKVDMIII